jgi:hypothetical protein
MASSGMLHHVALCFPALCRDYIQPYKQSACPTQHQICGLAPHEIIQSPPSGQRPPWTKDIRGLQYPL